MGSKKYTHEDWITTDNLEKREERKTNRRLHSTTVAPAQSDKIRAQAAYTENNKMVKKNIRADERAYLDSLAVEAEEAAHHGNKRTVCPNTKKLYAIVYKQRDP